MILTFLASTLICIAFSITFNVRGHNILLAGIAGGIGYIVFTITASAGSFISIFLASASVVLYSEAVARIFQTPASVYLSAGLIPLVPGGEMFRFFVTLIERQTDTAVAHFINSLLQAGAIAIGIIVVSSIVKLIPPLKVKKWTAEKK